jgi:hypothetical protein
MIITIDGPHGIGVTSQALTLAQNIKLSGKTVTVLKAKTADECLDAMEQVKSVKTDVIIFDGFALNDLCLSIMDGSIRSIPFKTHPNFINVYSEFNIKNKPFNVIMLPDVTTEFILYHDERRFNPIHYKTLETHTEALRIIDRMLPANTAKFEYFYVKPKDKLLEVQKNMLKNTGLQEYLK